MTIAQEELKKLLHYDPDTGVFTWIVKTRGYKYGMEAGDIKTCKKWGKSYRRISLKYKRYYAHRLVFIYMTGSFPVNEVDHINGNGLDNRWCNLRDVTSSENNKNLRLNSLNKSGISGIYWSKNKSNWHTQLRIDGKITYLGSYLSIFDAACTVISARQKHGYHKNHGSDRPL